MQIKFTHKKKEHVHKINLPNHKIPLHYCIVNYVLYHQALPRCSPTYISLLKLKPTYDKPLTKSNMKTKLLFLSLTLCLLSFSGGDDEKLTFKELVEQKKPVKVFFSVRDIIDEYDEKLLKTGNPNAKTPVRTSMPPEFYSAEIKAGLIKQLNEGLQVADVFVEGDISSLPESNNSKTQYRDLSKLPDGFYGLVDIEGEYTRTMQKRTVEGNQVIEVLNFMEIKSHLSFYMVKGGEVDKYGDMLSKSTLLGNARSKTVNSDKIENLEYMEKTFPALSLLSEYKETMDRFLKDFTDKQMKKHNKAVAKRK